MGYLLVHGVDVCSSVGFGKMPDKKWRYCAGASARGATEHRRRAGQHTAAIRARLKAIRHFAKGGWKPLDTFETFGCLLVQYSINFVWPQFYIVWQLGFMFQPCFCVSFVWHIIFSPVHAPVRSVPSRPSHQNTKTPLRRLAKHPIPFSLILEGSLTHQDLPGVWQIAATSKSGTVLCWPHSGLGYTSRIRCLPLCALCESETWWEV